MAALDPLNVVVAWIIIKLHAGLGALFGADTGLAWGLSIVILVMAIRLCLVPLFVKQVHAQRKMAQHAPQLQELRKKYKNDKQRLNEETMKFYKENGVNPLAGCLPMIPQMIVFFALFNVLRQLAEYKTGNKLSYGITVAVAKSASKATIFGVHLGDKLLFRPAGMHVTWQQSVVILLTVVVSATTTFMTVRQSAKRGLMQTGVDPSNPMAQSQKFMQYIVPFFSLTGLYWQYGLVLYWVTTNLWTLGQQYFMFRNWTVEPATAGAAGGTGPVTTSPAKTSPARTSPARTGTARTGTAKAGTTGASGARTGAARTGSAKTGAAKTGTTAAASTAAASTAAARTGAARTGAGKDGRVSSGAAKASPARTASAAKGAPAGPGRNGTGTTARNGAAPANGPDGGTARRLLGFGRAKPEAAPEPEVPAAKVVRQQPVRQARSKRSGKR